METWQGQDLCHCEPVPLDHLNRKGRRKGWHGRRLLVRLGLPSGLPVLLGLWHDPRLREDTCAAVCPSLPLTCLHTLVHETGLGLNKEGFNSLGRVGHVASACGCRKVRIPQLRGEAIEGRSVYPPATARCCSEVFSPLAPLNKLFSSSMACLRHRMDARLRQDKLQVRGVELPAHVPHSRVRKRLLQSPHPLFFFLHAPQKSWESGGTRDNGGVAHLTNGPHSVLVSRWVRPVSPPLCSGL